MSEESVHSKKVRAVQAVKILRGFYDEVYHPYTQAKIKAIPERPKFLISVNHFRSRDDKVLEAIQTLQGEIEAIPE